MLFHGRIGIQDQRTCSVINSRPMTRCGSCVPSPIASFSAGLVSPCGCRSRPEREVDQLSIHWIQRSRSGGWTPVAPSRLPFYEGDPPPVELDEAAIAGIVTAFQDATTRALDAGFQVIEIHAAHGYLLHEFMSPLSNRRTDQYGRSLENRMRLPLQVVDSIRRIMPAELPLFVRISATDWADGGWDLDQSVVFARRAKDLGVDLIDVSSGALVPKAQIPVAKG